MSFERPNLHFTVQRKASGPAAANFRPLLDAGGCGRRGGWACTAAAMCLWASKLAAGVRS